MRIALTALAMALLLAACAAESEPSPQRLVITDGSEVATMNADGSDRQVVATADEGTFYQPIWSPDGSLIAFSQLATTPTINVVRVDDQAMFSTAADTFPFYFSWSTGNELALLRNDTSGLRLDTTRFTDSGLSDIALVESGAPLYYSWRPQGGEMATHVGFDGFAVHDLNESTPLDLEPGIFQAPNWTERGIFAVAAGEPRQTLALTRPDGETQVIASLEGPSTFIPNRDGSLVAVQSLAEPGQFQSAAFQTLPRVAANRLVVINVDAGTTTTVTSDPVLAYFWSPSDNQLLLLDIVEGPAARWQVWEDGGLVELVRFTPSQRFITEVVPFFDQYAQSLSLWAPDGSAIAFTGTIEDQTGVWVAPIGAEPILVTDGDWVSWAP